MKRILVIGCCGSGKSVFARKLGEITGFPVTHMDLIFWKENWAHITREQMNKELEKIYPNETWIIDGNYSSTLENRIKQADTIFFLDLPEEVCIQSEKERRGKPRPDLPSYLKEEYDPEFEQFIKDFKTNERPFIFKLMNDYSNKEYIVFTSRDEVNNYIENYKNK